MTDVAPHEWEELDKAVRRSAKDVVRKWPEVIEADDVQQDVMMILLESPSVARKILDSNDDTRRQMLWGLGHRVASKEMTDYEHFSGQYTYTVDEVRALLEADVLTEEIDGLREEIIDLMDALEQMAWEKSAYVDPILGRYVGGLVPDKNSAERKSLNRAVDSLTEHMNRNHRNRTRNAMDGPGARKVVSNAFALRMARFREEGA